MKVVIPMAGEGSRFVAEGYTFPKPLIDVDGKPMIQRVIENLDLPISEYIFLVRKAHLDKFPGLSDTLKIITNDKYRIVEVSALTQGAACTALLAKEFINTDEDILIANSDQIIEYQPNNFINLKQLTNVDGIVFCFNSTHPKWSFVKVDDNGMCLEVAEKKPISNIATCGIYWYRHGYDFLNSVEKMIEKDIRTNNEFYIAPVYNEMISDNKSIIPFYVDKMWGVGTPEDLNFFIGAYDKS